MCLAPLTGVMNRVMHRAACAVQPDQRFEHVVNLVRKGTFGWADFFEPVMDSITSGGDYYLLANDFPSYIEAQVHGAHHLSH